MTVDEVKAKIAPHRDELTQLGVASLSVFGSTARGEAREDSDIDLLVELNRDMGYFGLFDIQYRLEEILERPVDLITEGGLKPRIREHIVEDLVRDI